MKRRKRLGKTDYRKRLKLLKSGKLRLVIRRSNKNVLMQIVEYMPNGDKIMISAYSNELKKFGWEGANGNISSAYLTGLLLGRKSSKANIKGVILDIGLQNAVHGSVLYAGLKGAVEGGLKVPCSETIFPSEDRIMGKHIANNIVSKFIRFNNKEIVNNFNEVRERIENA